jgi:hypothetical protein
MPDLASLSACPFRYVYVLEPSHVPPRFWRGAIRLANIGTEPFDRQYDDDRVAFVTADMYGRRAAAYADATAAMRVLDSDFYGIWQGDVAGGLNTCEGGHGEAFAFYLPAGDFGQIAAWAFQQAGPEGRTFVVSRVPMPWLDAGLAVDTTDQTHREAVMRTKTIPF